jgi:hypothetical protein
MWGTPTARDWKDTGDMTNVPENGLLGRQVLNRETWPTPNARDGSHGGASDPEKRKAGGHSIGLDDAVHQGPGGGSLNPTWVEWLMGFPLGWTDLGASETRSSRKSPNGSATESSNTKPRQTGLT